MTTQKYTFESTPTYGFKDTDRRKHHRRATSHTSEGENDPTDGSGSLTYSAASSINSAGESTDSSFGEIMRVLDGQEDTKEIAAYLKKEAARQVRDEKSVADSLAYSTDAESHMRSLATEAGSHLHGDLISTITGQTSDQNAYDGGGYSIAPDRDTSTTVDSPDSDGLLFSPAEHTDSMKRLKDRKRRERRDKKAERKTEQPQLEKNSTPRTKNGGFDSTPRVTNGGSGGVRKSSSQYVESRQGTPPTSRPPKSTMHHGVEMTEEEDVWYAKWWMFCFPETVKNAGPKR